MKLKFSQAIPHIVAVAVFLVVTVVFFKPLFVDHKTIDQHDIQQWEGSSKAVRDFRDKTGEEGLWAPTMFSGMPAYLINVLWGNGPVNTLKKIMGLGLPHPVNNIFLAFLSYYILLLAFHVRPYLAIVGAMAFGLSSFMIIGLGAGHNGRIGAIAFMPLALAGIHWMVQGKRWVGFGVTALGLALHLRENHVQMTYYLLLMVLMYGAVQMAFAYREKRLAPLLVNLSLLIPAVVLAAGTFFGQFWAITEYGKYSIRGKSELASVNSEASSGLGKRYAFEYSNGIWEPFVLLVPNFYGGSSAEFLYLDQESKTYKALVQPAHQQEANQLAGYSTPYWGPQSTTAPYYAGAIICFLFVLGIAYAEKKYVIWLVPLSALSIMMSWGENFSTFNYFLFDFLPGYNKFRSVTFTLVIILLAMPLLGLMGLENMLKAGWDKKTQKVFVWALSLTAGLCLLLALTGGFGSFMREGESQLPGWFISALKDDRVRLLRGDAWRSFFLIALFATLLFARLKKWVKDPVLFLAAALLVTVDLASVSSRYFTKDKYVRRMAHQAFPKNAADEEILKDKAYYRVYNLQNPWNEARTSYFHHSIGGYHGAKIRRYQDLYDSCILPQTQQFIEDAQQGRIDFPKYGVLNMLNVRYIVYGPEKSNIIPNPEANGPAWFVREVKSVKSPSEELAGVAQYDMGNTAVVNASEFKVPEVAFDSASSITLLGKKPNEMKYEVTTATDNLAVFSEIYYPEGWEATIDGKEAEILRANYVLRALRIPAGKHEVTFQFKPKAYVIGNRVTAASSWALLLVVVGTLGWAFWKGLKGGD